MSDGRPGRVKTTTEMNYSAQRSWMSLEEARLDGEFDVS